jgi:multicomponent Na+:H+ antiporter subunit G
MIDLFSSALIVSGLFFYLAGTVGLLRLPDTLCRLHAATKADNLGLGLLVFGLVLQLDDPFGVLKLLLIWILVLAASAAGGQLIARQVQRDQGDPP